MTSLRDPRGNLTQYAYDLLARRTSLTDPLSHVWATAYANLSGAQAGQTRVTLTDPLTFQTRQDFDRTGRLASVQYLNESPKNTPDVTFTYDKLSNRTHMDETATGGSTWVRKTTYTYDKARRLVSAGFDTDGNGTIDQAVSYQYDAGGLRTRLTLPGSLNVTYSYGAKGQLVSLTDWASRATSYAYDNVGRLIAAIRANGLRSGYTYDAAGRLRQLRHSKGKKVYGHFAYEVDRRGNRIQALEAVPQAATGATTLLYNDPGVWYYLGNWAAANPYQTTSNISAGVKMAFFGDQATLTMGQGPDHSICDIYIDAALWRSIDGYAASAGDRTLSITLDHEGPHVIDIRNRPEKNTASSGYTLRFKSLATLAGASLYDLRTLKYTYDALARLIDAKYYPGVNTSIADVNLPRRYQYAFDRAGNRTQQIATVAGTPTTTDYTYDNANRITGDGFGSYVHDDAGRLTSYANFPLTWDRANRVLSYAAVPVSWVYNGLGQRVRRTVSNYAPTDYLLDVQPGLWKILASTDTSDGSLTRFLHEPTGQHTIQYPAGAWYWPLPDTLNSTRTVVDASLVVGGTREFSPYGDIVNQTGGLLTPFDFTGEFLDPTPMNYLRAREYYAAPGRFLSLDPLEGDMSQPMSLNRYAYVQGNVVNAVDPSGEIMCQQESRCIGTKTVTYKRLAAAEAAFNLSINGPNSYSRQLELYPNNSAVFMSLCLVAGGFPMSAGENEGDIFDTGPGPGGHTGWRAHCNPANKIAGNYIWKNHNISQTLPIHDNALIGYIWGSAESGGSRLQASPPALADLFNTTSMYKSSGDVDAKAVNGVMRAFGSTFGPGDYVHIDAAPVTHGFLLVGTGPALKCDAKALNSPTFNAGVIGVGPYSNSDLIDNGNGTISNVFYVADWGLQRNTARPFYCSRLGDPIRGKSAFFNHTFWNFIRVPDTITVPCNYLYTPDPSFTVDNKGTITGCGR